MIIIIIIIINNKLFVFHLAWTFKHSVPTSQKTPRFYYKQNTARFLSLTSALQLSRDFLAETGRVRVKLPCSWWATQETPCIIKLVHCHPRLLWTHTASYSKGVGVLAPRAGQTTLWHRAQNGTREDFLGSRRSLLSQLLSIYLAQPPSHCCAEHVHIHTYLTPYRLYMNYRCHQTTKVRMKHFYTNRSSANCWLDIYRWGVGLAVTGPIRDIRQNVLQSAFVTGSGSSSTVTASLLLIALLQEAFIRNMIIIVGINYTI
jgi:hypothetical protein